MTVWCMISCTGLIDYDVDYQTMNGERYCQILQHKVIPFFTQRRHSQKLYQQDGAPPHYSISARKLLDDKMRGRWIGRRGPTEWPPRSPDLSVCDFFFWGALRDRVYRHRPNNKDQLARRIEEEIQNFPQVMFDNAYKSFLRRVDACIGSNGLQFEQN